MIKIKTIFISVIINRYIINLAIQFYNTYVLIIINLLTW